MSCVFTVQLNRLLNASAVHSISILTKQSEHGFAFQLDSYQVNMKFEIISFATEAKEIMSITSPWSNSVDHVLQKLDDFDYKGKSAHTYQRNFFICVQFSQL